MNVSYIKQDFNQSLKYALTLREADKSFVKYIWTLIARLKHDSSFSTNPSRYNLSHTALMPKEQLINVHPATTANGHDYRLHNLTKQLLVNSYRTYDCSNGKKATAYYAIAIYFNNKVAAKDFVKEIGARKDEICFSAWIDALKSYEVVLFFQDGIWEPQCKELVEKLNHILMANKNRYKDAWIEPRVRIPSSIYDRWYDIFEQKTIWSPKEIRAKACRPINYKRLIAHINLIHYKYAKSRISFDSRTNYFISNSNRLDSKMIRNNLYIVNHIINEKNPYKTRSAKKDWKIAAEAYLNEVLGKFKYRQSVFLQEYNDLKETAVQRCVDISIAKDTIRNNEWQIDNSTKTIERCNRLRNIPWQEWDNEYEACCYRNNPKYLDNKILDNERLIKSCRENIVFEEKKIESLTKEVVEKATKQLLNNKESYLEMFFSKKEAELFVRSLNLNTKISGVKLRKIILDTLLDLAIIESDGSYHKKTSCRKYKFLFDNAKKFYDYITKILSKYSQFIIYSFKNINYMLKDDLAKGADYLINLEVIRRLLPYSFSPPG